VCASGGHVLSAAGEDEERGERAARPRAGIMTTLDGAVEGVIPIEDVLDVRSAALLERRRTSRYGARRRGWLVRRALMIADTVGLMVAFLVSLELYGGVARRADRVSDTSEVILFLATIPIWIVGASLYGLYRRDDERADHSTVDDLVGVFHLVTIGTWVFFVLTELTGAANPTVARLLAFWFTATMLVTVGRALARAACRRSIAYVQNTVIVGAGRVGRNVALKLASHPEYGLNVLGFVDADPLATDGRAVPGVLGTPDQLAEIVDSFGVDRVIVAFSNDAYGTTLDLIRSLQGRSVRIDIVPRLFEVFGPGVELHTAEGVPLIGLPQLRLSRSALALKRALDILLSLVGLVLLAPIFAIAAVAIKLDSPGPVFFRQVRRGHRGQVFRIWKFRTMTDDAEFRKDEFVLLNKHNGPAGDPRMFKIPDDPRTTRLGRLLRSHSLDELPQLFNVLSGEMSLVGPRPLILREDDHVLEWRRRRLDLKPGVTGLWQVLGRDGIPFEEMTTLDYLYVTSWSFFGDIKLILRTIPLVFRAHPG
jgi:exopolysaccharide biosynthesis polyprenyl glycosylphosphotransferase